MAYVRCSSGGGTNIPQLSTGTVRGSNNTTFTYTATAECFFTVLWTLTYNQSGYRKLTLNNVDILNSSVKGTYCDTVHLQSGDVLTFRMDSSTTPAYYGVALIE